jgi:hypothetical protein
MSDKIKPNTGEHNYQIEITRLVADGILGNSSQTERIILTHRTKRFLGGFDTSEISITIARQLRTKIITVAHDDRCCAIKGGYCNCSPDIIDQQSGKVLNRGNRFRTAAWKSQ